MRYGGPLRREARRSPRRRRRLRVDDGDRPLVDGEVPGLSRGVPAGVAGQDDVATDAGAEITEVHGLSRDTEAGRVGGFGATLARGLCGGSGRAGPLGHGGDRTGPHNRPMESPTTVGVRPRAIDPRRAGRHAQLRRLAGLVLVVAIAGIAPAASGATMAPRQDAFTESAAERRLVRARRISCEPTADEPHQSQPRADRRRPPLQPVTPGGRLRGGAGRAQPPGDPDQPRRRADLAHRRRPPAGRWQPPDGCVGTRATSGHGAPVLRRDGRPRAGLPLRAQLQQQRGPDLAPGLRRQPHARLVDRHGGPGRRHQPGEPQLRHGLPRVQLAEGPDAGRRLPRGRVGRLRHHVRRHRDPEAHPAGRLRRRVAHRVQARHGPGRLGVRGGLPARHEDVARVVAVRQGRLLEHRADRLRGRPPALRPQGAPADPRAERPGDEAAGDRLEPRLDAQP